MAAVEPLGMILRDRVGLAVVLATIGALEVFRAVWFEPRAVGLACLHGAAPAIVCGARATLGWLTHFQVMGGLALLLGIVAVRGAPFAVTVAAVSLGAAGVIDYNVSWGMLGAALGAWAWLTASRLPPRCPARGAPSTPTARA